MPQGHTMHDPNKSVEFQPNTPAWVLIGPEGSVMPIPKQALILEKAVPHDALQALHWLIRYRTADLYAVEILGEVPDVCPGCGETHPNKYIIPVHFLKERKMGESAEQVLAQVMQDKASFDPTHMTH